MLIVFRLVYKNLYDNNLDESRIEYIKPPKLGEPEDIANVVF